CRLRSPMVTARDYQSVQDDPRRVAVPLHVCDPAMQSLASDHTHEKRKCDDVAQRDPVDLPLGRSLLGLPLTVPDDAYDVIVLGGGIQGAGCAQAVAAAGYRVCLLEQNAWGSGTSSRSSKLIHGGLRYLETFQFGLVRKSIAERKLLARIAPTLVRPLPFYIPVYEHSRHRPWQVFLGLGVYSAIGGFDRLSRFRVVPKREWHRLEGLERAGLQRVFQYWDTQTDDRLLTLAVVNSAEALGADVRQHARFLYATPRPGGYRVVYRRGDDEHHADGRAIINAAGPWAADLQSRIAGAPAPLPVELVKGAHIELAGRISDAVFYVESPHDGRAVFVMPWYDNTLVGTTETAFSGNPEDANASDQEVQYLLDAVRGYFPDFACKLVNSFAGVRVLPRNTSNFSSRQRDTLLQYDDEREPTLVSVHGGKLTTYRAMAEQIVARLARTLGPRPGHRSTRDIIVSRP
ncbi:MAG: glycerol-3-phosphate dehydrogenase/oxidase, partial [Lysobacter sp.]